VLCKLVGDIKPRHYSIASAQSVVGDRVDLLVVTLDWKTPSGECVSLSVWPWPADGLRRDHTLRAMHALLGGA
jgi:hypothetical protein